MPLPSFLQRFRRQPAARQAAAEALPASAMDVEAARVRARRRLIGMAVLVGAGVIGFPWLFETQPRPMSGDIQIVQGQPGADSGADLQISGAPPQRSSRSASGRVAVSGIVEPPAAAPVQDEPAATVAPEEKPVTRPEGKPEPRPAESRVEKAPEKPVAKAADKLAAKPAVKDATKESAKEPAKDAPKVASKGEGKAEAKAADKDKPGTRYVVQFGAFAEASSAHEARMKVERLGLKTYTQQVDTPAGKRIRVRMGPFADKAEADKAMATLRKAGLSGAVLTL